MQNPKAIDWRIVSIALFILNFVRYFIGIAIFNAQKARKPGGLPPLVPSLIPVIGHIPLRLLTNPLRFIHTDPVFWRGHPIRVRVMFREIYIIQGRKPFLDMMNNRTDSSFLIHRTFIQKVFGLPDAAMRTYQRDNSGHRAKHNPGTTVAPNNRVEFHGSNSRNSLLLGPGQASFFRKFRGNLATRLSCLAGEQWVYISDFQDVFKKNLATATIDAMCGPGLLERHPSFVHDFWNFEDYTINYLSGLPRFLNRKAHKARDVVLNAIMDWHEWAQRNFVPEAVDVDGNDPFWGCAFFRQRQEMFSQMDGFDAKAIASEDLAFIFSSNTNVLSSFWLTVEAFRNAELLDNVRQEVQACTNSNTDNELHLNMAKLEAQPLLQAMFAENLRVRTHGFLLRYTSADVEIDNWKIPKNRLCITSLTSASMDPEIWCQESNSTSSVHEFQPERFLKADKTTGFAEFSLVGKEGSWLPFSTGPHACPGRFFAKHQAILTLALMATLYDIEILATDEELRVNSKKFPRGVVPPRGNIPVRLRRRNYQKIFVA